jgi:hypothetical protein
MSLPERRYPPGCRRSRRPGPRPWVRASRSRSGVIGGRRPACWLVRDSSARSLTARSTGVRCFGENLRSDHESGSGLRSRRAACRVRPHRRAAGIAGGVEGQRVHRRDRLPLPPFAELPARLHSPLCPDPDLAGVQADPKQAGAFSPGITGRHHRRAYLHQAGRRKRPLLQAPGDPAVKVAGPGPLLRDTWTRRCPPGSGWIKRQCPAVRSGITPVPELRSAASLPRSGASCPVAGPPRRSGRQIWRVGPTVGWGIAR